MRCRTAPQRVVIDDSASFLLFTGVFIKMGQHMASLIVLPVEWTSTMRPLQDQCEPTPYEDVEALFFTDIGSSISEFFLEFDPSPIGVASLAQVHVGRHRDTGRQVAVKVSHLEYLYALLIWILSLSYNTLTLLSSVILTWKWSRLH